MKDIGSTLMNIMVEEDCTPLLALLLLDDKEKLNVGLLQSKPEEQPSWRLCDSGNF